MDTRPREESEENIFNKGEKGFGSLIKKVESSRNFTNVRRTGVNEKENGRTVFLRDLLYIGPVDSWT